MLGKIFNKQDIAEQLSDKGFSIRHDLSHKFNLKRKKSDEGFDVYVLENASRNERVVIKRILFDRLRAALQNISTAEKLEKPERINFAGKDYFLIYTPKDAMKDDIVIEQMDPPKLSTRYLRLSHGSLRTLMKLMYDERLKHPNDALSEIIEYHKLFHFSFVEAGESITSDLILRKDVLSHTEEFVPSRSRDFLSTEREGGNGKEADEISGSKRNLKQEDKDKQAMFRSRLAERNAEKDYVIDYSQLFAVEDPNEQVIEEEVEKASQKKRKFRRGQGYIQLPMHTKDIKELAKLPFQCELSPEEMEDLRSLLTNSDHNQFFLGFEIIDAVYRSYGKLRTFRFPLYYMKVELLESGRNILLVPEDGGAFYINHLALANLVESFSSVSSAIENSETFFKTLLNQQIQWGDQITRMHLRRNLPIAADIFNQTRDILLGLPGENGKGGLLGNLKIVGAECDLDSVLLFEAQKKSIPTSVTLETDLDTISKIAEDEPRRFYDSLLGRFLSPEMQSLGKGKILPFCDRVLFPGAVPKATKNLLSKLNEHDLLLLEGPPGTGKTFTIMNLFIHCVNTGKKMLIVSDKPGAIHALTEKVEEYLLGKERASAYAKMLTKLMYTAIKVVDALPQDNGQLGPWCDELRRMLALDNADSNTSQAPKTEDYVAKIVAIDKHMTQVKSRIQALFEKKIDAAAPLDERVAPKYLHATTLKDIDSIIGFVDLLGIGAKHALQHAKSNHNHPAYLTRRFMQDRHFLIKNYPELYNFYSIDADNLPAHYRKLDETRNLLQEIAKRKPKSIVSFLKIARTFKGHPILEFLLQKWAAKFPQKSHPVVKFFRFISCFIYHPLISHVKRLQKVMYNDLHLLQFRSQTAPGVWREFQMIHELLMESTSNLKTDIPLSYEIVALINEKQKKSTPGSDSQAEASSLQAHLQTLLHLQNDRDQLIKDQFLASLRKVVHQAFSSDAKGSTSLATSINAKLNELKTLTHIDQGMHLLEEIREKLIKAFPFWVCRKQSVSFLFPTEERIFDLVIVDEATQCRVDDALPLLFRAKKIAGGRR